MGMERYKYHLSKRDLTGFNPTLFTPERFLDFEEGDTNITPEVARFRRHYELAADRFARGSVEHVGDKVIARNRVATALVENFPSPKIVFIYRDLLPVASSFCVRARNPDDTHWLETTTHVTAVARWHEAFAAADFLTAGLGADAVMPVKYERLFSGDRRTCDALFGFLGLEVTDAVSRQFAGATADWGAHELKPIELTDEQREYVLENCDASVVERFDTEFDRQVLRFAS
jgi:hypothetical protein